MSSAQVVAYFESLDDATEAARSLEQAGVDALYVRVTHRAPVSEQGVVRADRARLGRTFRRAASGGLVGAGAGLIITAVIAIFTGNLLILVPGFIVGAILGGFFAVAVDLTMNPDIEDAMGGVEPSGPDAVEYFGPEDAVERVTDVLQKHDPTSVVQR